MNRNVRVLIILAVGVVAPLGIVVAHGLWSDRGPDPMPTHWELGGEVNGTTGAAAFFWWSLAISIGILLIAAATTLAHRVHQSGRLLISVLVAASWMVSAIYVTTTALARGHATAASVAMPWYAIVLAVLVPAAVGVLGWRVIAPESITDVARPVSDLGLRSSERVVWIGHAQSGPMRIAAVVIALVGGLVFFRSTAPAVIVLAVALLLAWVSELTVRVDQAGLHVLWGPVGWPRQRIGLDAIARVHAQDIRPMQWGGWGYRITSGGTASIVRSGPGMVVEKRNGNTFVVTVDDADQGADVLNALLVRAAPRS